MSPHVHTTWPMRIESGLAAHFKQDDGPSRPGVMWRVGLRHEGHDYQVHVKALLADDATRATRKDERYQAQTAMDYLADLLASGWHPSQPRDHTIHIGNPHPAAAKPWWKFWH
jgi:hypothetical protein